jgi:hypothetical protein
VITVTPVIEAPTPTIKALADQFDGRVPEHTVRDTLVGAVRDLLGSISTPALPEMAFRLAHYRLSGLDRAAAAPAHYQGPRTVVPSSAPTRRC